MISGIYQLNFLEDNFYIGRSSNIEARFISHKYNLKIGKHNYKMLAAYKKYGMPLSYNILELCSISAQLQREIYWINKTEAIDFGLNVSKGGEDVLVGEDNSQSKYTNNQIVEVLKYLANYPDIPIKDIPHHTGVSISVIKDISCGNRHLWLKEEYPSEYQKLVDNKKIRELHSLTNLTTKFQFKRKLETYPKLVSPEGLEYQVDNLTEFAKLYNLQVGNLSSVLNGRRKTHKGWRLANQD